MPDGVLGRLGQQRFEGAPIGMLGLVVAILSQEEQTCLENILHRKGPGSRLARQLKTVWAKNSPIAVLRLLQIPRAGSCR